MDRPSGSLIVDLETGEDRRFAQGEVRTWSLEGETLAYSQVEASLGRDLNGDGEAQDTVLFAVRIRELFERPRFSHGDCNDDGMLDISDPIYNLEHQLLGKPAPPPPFPGCGPESLPVEESLPCETPPVSCP